MIEPSKEAIEAAQSNGTSLDRIRITHGQAEVILSAALPIERARWEAEARERLEKALCQKGDEETAIADRCSPALIGAVTHRARGQVLREFADDLDAIFEKGEQGTKPTPTRVVAREEDGLRSEESWKVGDRVKLSPSFGGGGGEIVGEFQHSYFPVRRDSDGKVKLVAPRCLDVLDA